MSRSLAGAEPAPGGADARVDAARAGPAAQRALPGGQHVPARVDGDRARKRPGARVEADRRAPRAAVADHEVRDEPLARVRPVARSQQHGRVAGLVGGEGDGVGVAGRAERARGRERAGRRTVRDGRVGVPVAGGPQRQDVVAAVAGELGQPQASEPERPAERDAARAEQSRRTGAELAALRPGRQGTAAWSDHQLREVVVRAADRRRRGPVRGKRGGGEREEHGDQHGEGHPGHAGTNPPTGRWLRRVRGVAVPPSVQGGEGGEP